MSKKIWMTLCVRGKTTEYSFDVWAPEKYLDEWRDQGLNIDPIANTIPKWVADLGLTKLWCRLQDWGLIKLV